MDYFKVREGLFFALIAEDRLYFKVDDATRPDFERQGMEPFRSRTISMIPPAAVPDRPGLLTL